MKFVLTLLASLIATHAIADVTRIITVKGESEAEAAPDFVRVAATVAAESRLVGQAKTDADDRMRKVVAALGTFKIDKQDVAFGGVDVGRTFRTDRNDNEIPTGFRVARSFEVRLRDKDSYEQLIHALVAAGAEGIEQPESGVDDEDALKSRALQSAARNARMKADMIAKELQARLGSPIEVGEDRLEPPGAFQQQGADNSRLDQIIVTAQKRGIAEPLLFVPDNIRVHATVWVRFEIIPN